MWALDLDKNAMSAFFFTFFFNFFFFLGPRDISSHG